MNFPLPRRLLGHHRKILLALAALVALPLTAHAAICRVTPSGYSTNNGSSWGQALDLQTAVTLSICSEIWVREGRYVPGPTPDDAFVVAPGTAVYGGFAGTETRRDQRNPKANPTVLSGDIDDDDIVNPDGVTPAVSHMVGTNSNQVVVMDGTTSAGPIEAGTVLDGFIITAGDNQGSGSSGKGGGLYCDGSASGAKCNPTIRNVTFVGNYATSGGAFYANGDFGQSNPVLHHVVFHRNAAIYGGAMYDSAYEGEASPNVDNTSFTYNSASWGGAMYNEGYEGESSPQIRYVVFDHNEATDRFGTGGAMLNGATRGGISNPTLNHVTFTNNSADYQGGAMYSSSGTDGYGHDGAGTASPVLNAVTFIDNHADDDGGAFYNGGDYNISCPKLTNVTFARNSAAWGGAIYTTNASSVASCRMTMTNATFHNNTATGGGGAFANYYSSPILSNVIAWGDHGQLDPELYNYDTSPAIDHSIIAGSGGSGANWDSAFGDDHGGNMDANPWLGNLGMHGGSVATLLPLSPGPAVDTGNPATCPSTDARGVPRPQGAGCDIGAVERVPGGDIIFQANFDRVPHAPG